MKKVLLLPFLLVLLLLLVFILPLSLGGTKVFERTDHLPSSSLSSAVLPGQVSNLMQYSILLKFGEHYLVPCRGAQPGA